MDVKWLGRCGLACLALIGAGQAEPVRVERLIFEGVQLVDQARLRDALETREWPFLPWREKRPFEEATFEADLLRVAEFYADRGYPDARVTASDVQYSDDGRKVDLTIVVSEGEPILVESIAFSGFDPVRPRELEALRGRLPLAVGRPLDRDLLVASGQLALFELGDRGYPYARVEVEEQVGTRIRSRRLTLTAEPGLSTLFGSIDIVGNTSVDDALIRRELVYRPGALFSASLLRESESRLTAQELFESATIEVIPREGLPGDVDTQVRVEEAEHRQYTLGGGYGSEGDLDLTASLRHINFFGGGRTARMQGRWSSLDRGLLVDFVEPRFMNPRYSLRVAGQGQVVDEPTFGARHAEAAITLTRRFGPAWPLDQPRTTAAFSYMSSFSEFETSSDFTLDPGDADDLIALGLDPVTGIGEGRLSALAIDLARDTTRDSLNARDGYAAFFHFEQAGRLFGGRFTYTELNVEGRQFIPVSEYVVVANRIRMGTLDEPSDAGAEGERRGPPIFKRYFLGGARGLRGWGRNEVAPRTESGLPLGGLTHIDASTELRWSQPNGLGVVLFADVGNVWDQSWHLDLGDLRSAIGAGFRLPTPLGLARVDYGYQLTPIDGLLVEGEPETRRWRFHFRIGQAF